MLSVHYLASFVSDFLLKILKICAEDIANDGLMLLSVASGNLRYQNYVAAPSDTHEDVKNSNNIYQDLPVL